MPSQRSAPNNSASYSSDLAQMISTTCVVIPVKAFHHAKERLSDLLTPAERIVLTKYCADRVIAAASNFDVFVVCDDENVAQWARDHKAKVVWQPEVGLNAAVRRGVDFAHARGKQLAIVSHSDLPLATDFTRLISAQSAETFKSSITLVPDRHEDGTNVMVLPTNFDFEFCYGKNSFTAHQQMAKKCGLSVRIVRDQSLAVDIDTADDLAFAKELEK